MTVPARLSGGILTRRDPKRIPTRGSQADPFFRMQDPFDLFVSTGAVTLVQRGSAMKLGEQSPSWVEVAVREVNGSKYIIVSPTTEQNPLKVALAYRPGAGGAYIRTADDIFRAAGLEALPGGSYRMEAALVEDEEYGWVVAANWTRARMEGRSAAAAPGEAADPGATPPAESGQ